MFRGGRSVVMCQLKGSCWYRDIYRQPTQPRPLSAPREDFCFVYAVTKDSPTKLAPESFFVAENVLPRRLGGSLHVPQQRQPTVDYAFRPN